MTTQHGAMLLLAWSLVLYIFVRKWDKEKLEDMKKNPNKYDKNGIEIPEPGSFKEPKDIPFSVIIAGIIIVWVLFITIGYLVKNGVIETKHPVKLSR